jgi:hypothetical protein
MRNEAMLVGMIQIEIGIESDVIIIQASLFDSDFDPEFDLEAKKLRGFRPLIQWTECDFPLKALH